MNGIGWSSYFHTPTARYWLQKPRSNSPPGLQAENPNPGFRRFLAFLDIEAVNPRQKFKKRLQFILVRDRNILRLLPSQDQLQIFAVQTDRHCLTDNVIDENHLSQERSRLLLQNHQKMIIHLNPPPVKPVQKLLLQYNKNHFLSRLNQNVIILLS